MTSSSPFREPGEQILGHRQRLGAVEIVVHLGDDLVLGVVRQLFLEPLGAQDLRRGAGDAHHVADLDRLATVGLVQQPRLQAAELDVVGADVGDDVRLVAAESGPVIDLDHRDAGLVGLDDRGDGALAHRREQDQIDSLGDEVLDVRHFGRRVALAIPQVVLEAELTGPILQPSLESGVEGNREVGDRHPDRHPGGRHRSSGRHRARGRRAGHLLGGERGIDKRVRQPGEGWRRQTERERPPQK